MQHFADRNSVFRGFTHSHLSDTKYIARYERVKLYITRVVYIIMQYVYYNALYDGLFVV
jgi:hypothetical protein